MRRGSKPAKARVKAKPPAVRKAPKNEDSRVRDLEKRLSESLERERATSEILRVVSNSLSNLGPVFDTVLANAARLCDAHRGALLLFKEGTFQTGAELGTPAGLSEARKAPYRPDPRTVLGRMVVERRAVYKADLLADPLYEEREPRTVAAVELGGSRSLLAVPLLKDGVLIGAITIHRPEPGPFSDDHIALLQTFADQAVIAIENVRLFNETKEALEQQRASGEILGVISSSPTDVQPVFDVIVQSAVRLCGGLHSNVYRVEDGLIHLIAHHNFSPAALERLQHRFPIPVSEAEGLAARVIREGVLVHLHDAQTDPDVPETTRRITQALGARSVLYAPMLRDRVGIGVIVVSRAEVKPFSDKEIALIRTFADQAVIAIENVRLFKELEARNRDLTEALTQQTTTSEILRVIAGSPTELQPVLDALVESASGLCRAADTFLLLVEGDQLRVAALHGSVEESARLSNAIHRGWMAGRAIVDARTVHVEDLTKAEAEFPLGAQIAVRLGHRTALAMPLLRKGVPMGALFLRRREVRQFSDKEIALLQTFADQAVIAIENVRLFKELEASNREIAAKSRQIEVASQHKSEFLANMSHELRTPLNAIIGFSEVLAEGMFGEVNEKQTEYLRDILESGQHLLSLINDILDLSKIEAGRVELELTDFDLGQAILNALTLVRERAGRLGIALHHAVDQRLGQIRGDERKIKQVLLNLLSNALKFTPEGGRVDVRASIADGLAEVSVTDTGVGIAPEDQEAVFEEFRQVGTAEKKVEGTGLGLALSRKFIELHGGRIGVKSQLGAGSTFTFTLPLRRGA